MHRTYALWLTLALFTIALAGCGRAQAQPSLAIGCEEFGASPFQVREMALNAKGAFRVALCANLSTGYSWEDARIADPTVLEVTDEVYLMGERAKDHVVGAPGVQLWTFRTLKKGETTIAFVYSQPWQGGEKGAWRLDLQVAVR